MIDTPAAGSTWAVGDTDHLHRPRHRPAAGHPARVRAPLAVWSCTTAPRRTTATSTRMQHLDRRGRRHVRRRPTTSIRPIWSSCSTATDSGGLTTPRSVPARPEDGRPDVRHRPGRAAADGRLDRADARRSPARSSRARRTRSARRRRRPSAARRTPSHLVRRRRADPRDHRAGHADHLHRPLRRAEPDGSAAAVGDRRRRRGQPGGAAGQRPGDQRARR